MKFLQLKFIPQNSDFALFILRLWAGGALLLNHGLGKLTHFGAMKNSFMDPLGIGSLASLSFSTLAEFVCAALIVLGFLTRFSALVILINLGVAFYFIHGMKLSGAGSGELAFVYFGAFLTVFLAGPGKISIDGKSGAA
jgi:putative oxidoreductase